MTKQCLRKQIWKNVIGANPKGKQLSYKLIMMDYFLVLFIFVSTEDIIVNNGENMFKRNMFGIISSKRNQKGLKFFHCLTLGTVHISYLKEAKHQTCQSF